DGLEVIKIQKQYRQLSLPAVCLVNGLPQQAAQQTAIRQSRQAVMVGQVLHLFRLSLACLGFPTPALGQAVAHMPEQSAHQQQQDIGVDRPLQVGSAQFIGGSELLLRRQTDQHTEGKAMELTYADIPLDAIQRRYQRR